MKRGCGLLLLCLLTSAAAAQQPTAPEPILRATLEPARVVVGQPAVLRIDVLAPNYMTAPPLFPELQLRNAVTRELGTVNMSEQQGGVTYAGMRREFAIHPQEAGSYAIADQQIGVSYAAAPPATRTATLALPRLAFEAYIPPQAQALDPFIAASKLVLRQNIERTSDNLKIGDAVVRTLTIEAEGVPAMLLPPLPLDAPAGLAAYPDQPSLQERTDRRTDELTATRIERATYMLQQGGQYVLPAIDLAWWNLREQKIEHARADAVAFSVIASPAQAQGGGADEAGGEGGWRTAIDWLLSHWPALVLVVLALILLACLSPRAFRALRGWIERRRAAYAGSEPAAFAQFRKTAHRGDLRSTYFALLAWLERFEPVAPAHSLKAFRAAAQDPALDRDLALIEAQLFAATANARADDKPPQSLLHQIAAARRELLRPRSDGATPPIASSLNPPDPHALARGSRRAVAR